MYNFYRTEIFILLTTTNKIICFYYQQVVDVAIKNSRYVRCRETICTSYNFF